MDVTGKVIAINTAIIPYAQGIGFAIPINSAKSCTNDVTSGKESRTPWIGIVGLSITLQIARYYGLPMDHGVLVTKVAQGSPSEEAGIVEGDTILKIGNVETLGIEDLVKEIQKRKINEVVRILAIRNRREHFFELKLSEAP